MHAHAREPHIRPRAAPLTRPGRRGDPPGRALP